ncbi:MAG: beta galactosidase jelly roll domain-containing protein [Cyclobacteriaceae bacterium]|nr:beta galactosidase jelly roll domain-containing protein [Cyclobacteriaceae bacterium HetDA_MAG_MS6]
MRTTQIIIILNLLISSFKAQGKDGEMVVNLRGYWKFNIGDNISWAATSFDDSDWGDVFVPSAWEDEGFYGFDGYGWYRTSFDLGRIDKNEHFYIELGYIDDVDEVFVNGQLVGFTGSFPPNFRTAYTSLRRYYIPTELLKTTGNVIAVRVYDTIKEGGILQGDIGIYLKKPSIDVQVLEGLWKFKEGDDLEWKSPHYDDSHWDNALIPGFWRSYKKWDFVEGIAWYRKEFTLYENLKNVEDLVIVLGKIDDFDKVFLNGHLIGYTRDNRPLGASGSYQKIRIYGLLEKYLNRNGKNLIAVQVQDLGGNAGIYEGPIGIVAEKNFSRFIDRY